MQLSGDSHVVFDILWHSELPPPLGSQRRASCGSATRLSSEVFSAPTSEGVTVEDTVSRLDSRGLLSSSVAARRPELGTDEARRDFHETLERFKTNVQLLGAWITLLTL